MGFKVAEKEAICSFTLSAVGPVLISSGSSTKLNPQQSDSFFLSGIADSQGNIAYIIPGSSIKGVIRHYLYGFLKDEEKEEIPKLFGNVGEQPTASKISFSDAYADMNTVETVMRYNTVVGPISQSATKGLNNALAVRKGDFKAGFRLRNYKEKELAWILRALDGFNRQEIFIGGRVSRGFGRVSVSEFSMTLINGYTQELEPDVVGKYSTLQLAIASHSIGGENIAK